MVNKPDTRRTVREFMAASRTGPRYEWFSGQKQWSLSDSNFSRLDGPDIELDRTTSPADTSLKMFLTEVGGQVEFNEDIYWSDIVIVRGGHMQVFKW